MTGKRPLVDVFFISKCSFFEENTVIPSQITLCMAKKRRREAFFHPSEFSTQINFDRKCRSWTFDRCVYNLFPICFKNSTVDLILYTKLPGKYHDYRGTRGCGIWNSFDYDYYKFHVHKRQISFTQESFLLKLLSSSLFDLERSNVFKISVKIYILFMALDFLLKPLNWEIGQSCSFMQ